MDDTDKKPAALNAWTVTDDQLKELRRADPCATCRAGLLAPAHRNELMPDHHPHGSIPGKLFEAALAPDLAANKGWGRPDHSLKRLLARDQLARVINARANLEPALFDFVAALEEVVASRRDYQRLRELVDVWVRGEARLGHAFSLEAAPGWQDYGKAIERWRAALAILDAVLWQTGGAG